MRVRAEVDAHDAGEPQPRQEKTHTADDRQCEPDILGDLLHAWPGARGPMDQLLEDEPEEDRRNREAGDDEAEHTQVLVVSYHGHEVADGLDRRGGVRV